MSVDTKDRNLFHSTNILKNDTKKKRISYCKICAQNGFPAIPVRWQKYNGKRVSYEFNDSTEPHLHQICLESLMAEEF